MGTLAAAVSVPGPLRTARCCRSAADMPVTYDTYPGTSGRQHGDKNDTAPAAAAPGTASRSGPEKTRCPTPLITSLTVYADPTYRRSHLSRGAGTCHRRRGATAPAQVPS